MTDFFDNVLARNTGTGSFDHVVLSFDVIQSSFNRRRLNTGLSMKIDGTAYYASVAPSVQSLSMDLRAYFAAWGVNDLESYLHATGLPSARVATVAINGKDVKPVSGTGYNAGANVQQQPVTGTTTTVSPGIIAGLAVACLILLAAIAVLVIQVRRRKGHFSRRRRTVRRSPSSARRGASPAPAVESDTEVADHSPKVSQSQTGQNSDESDDYSVGGVSIDLSLYTTDDSIVNAPAPAKKYNTKRLDKVIEMAKKHSEVGSKERLAI